jgi:hypothetical protein
MSFAADRSDSKRAEGTFGFDTTISEGDLMILQRGPLISIVVRLGELAGVAWSLGDTGLQARLFRWLLLATSFSGLWLQLNLQEIDGQHLRHQFRCTGTSWLSYIS